MPRGLAFVLLVTAAGADDRMFRFEVDQDRVAGAADFSFLNRTLTQADRLFVCGEHFCRVGKDLQPHTPDDERVRLFGVNTAFAANFPEEADAVRIAKRLRRLGVNLVRLHHMDTSPDAEPASARSILTTGPYPSLNQVSLARLRVFLSALSHEGIYVNLNLHVGYQFRPEVDGIPAYAGEAPRLGKPVHMFHPRMVALQVEFTRKLIDGLKLQDNPVLGMVEINNESSLVEAWQKGQLQKQLNAEYKAALLADASEPHSDDEWIALLVRRDREYLDTLASTVKDATNKWVPVAGTQHSFYGPLILDSHAGLDYHDNHFYIDHYNFPNRSWDARDWRIRNSSAVGTGLAPYLNMAVSREAGKPYTVSEYNQQWPNQQAAEIDPTLAVFAAFQDWDSVMHFAYSHGRSWDTKVPGGFDMNGDWAKWPGFGQTAWLFRTGAISPGKAPLVVTLPRDVRMRAAREKRVGNTAAALSASMGYDPLVALLRRVAIAGGETKTPLSTAGPGPYRSDTGEVVYDREAKVFTVAAERVAGVFGFVGKRKITAGALDVQLAPESRGFATVLLTPLDGQPLAKSLRMLLSTPGYILTTIPGSDPPRPQRLVPYADSKDWFTLEPEPGSDKPSGNRSGSEAPVWMERVESVITIRNGARALAVYPLDGNGARLAPVRAQKIRGGWRINLQTDGQQFAPWYELEAK